MLIPDHRPDKAAWLLVYPDTYEVGLPNQGLQILYEILNERPDAVAERSYAPWTDLAAVLRREGLPLFSLDTHRAAGDFDVLAFNLSAMQGRGRIRPLRVRPPARVRLVGVVGPARRPGRHRGRLRAGPLRGHLARRRHAGVRGAEPSGGTGGGAQADGRRPGRLALPPAAIGPPDRGGPRPAQRRGLPGLHAWLPLLPGGDDHPPGPGASRRAGAHDGGRRPPPHRLRRGRPHVAQHRRLLGYRGGRGRHGLRRRLRAGIGVAAQPARRRLHRGDRRADPACAPHRPHLRPGSRHLADAAGHQQAHPRGGPLRGRRVRLLERLAPGQALLH